MLTALPLAADCLSAYWQIQRNKNLCGPSACPFVFSLALYLVAALSMPVWWPLRLALLALLIAFHVLTVWMYPGWHWLRLVKECGEPVRVIDIDQYREFVGDKLLCVPWAFKWTRVRRHKELKPEKGSDGWTLYTVDQALLWIAVNGYTCQLLTINPRELTQTLEKRCVHDGSPHVFYPGPIPLAALVDILQCPLGHIQYEPLRDSDPRNARWGRTSWISGGREIKTNLRP